jgi:MFS transporter, AAHS family, 4-hydroxybenzoate transporter
MTPASTPKVIDVQSFIDTHALSSVQRRLLFMCFLVVAIDGFDTALIGFIAPAIRAEWSVAVSRLGSLFAAGLVGLMIGAFAVGPLADRHGRKTMLTASMLIFGLASTASSFSGDISTLTWLRFVTGFGLGGAMPTSITLSSEYCPAPRRASLVTLMFCGFTIGSAIAGLIASQVLERGGWRPMLVAGGVAPLVLAPVLWWSLPESVRYLAMRGDPEPRIASVLSSIAPNVSLHNATFTGVNAPTISPVRQLFSGGLLSGTLLLWLAFFNSLLVVYLLSNWMPTLIQRTGASLSHAALITAMLQVGGTVGAIVVGRLMDAFDPHDVLGGVYLAGAVCIIAISMTTALPWLMALAVFSAGFCISGGQVGGNALSAAFYPTPYRATGVSWANGIGRSGSIVGSVLGGGMLALGWNVTTVYALVAIPAIVSGLALLALGAIALRTKRVEIEQEERATRDQS